MSSSSFQSQLPPANDRMMTTIFLAALLHLIVILGVTFSAEDSASDNDEAPGLEVILVNGATPRAKQNRDARYLAQRNQTGAGNTLAAGRALIPMSSPAPLERPGTMDGDGAAQHRTGQDGGEDAALATAAPAPRIIYFAAAPANEESSESPLQLEDHPDLGMEPNDDGIQLRLRGEARKQLWVSADTRESDVAVYLDGWRRKVERVGTVNFPNVARRQSLSGTPVIEVTINADGRLEQAVLRSSSGHPELDDAALRILRLAAPFDPFPRELGEKHDQIRIAYEWQFLGGSSQGSSVLYSDP
jgi:protein TonB